MRAQLIDPYCLEGFQQKIKNIWDDITQGIFFVIMKFFVYFKLFQHSDLKEVVKM